MAKIAVFYIICSHILVSRCQEQNTPLYPITASWFRDRFTTAGWNETLSQFAELGGDTVLLKAPPLVVRSKEDIQVGCHNFDYVLLYLYLIQFCAFESVFDKSGKH